MSVGLYLDEHVPRAIALALRLRGVDVLTAQEDESRGKSDREVLDRATQLGRVVFTQDEDFLREASRCQREGVPFSGVLYAHQLECTIGQLVMDL
jgi:predicted nuclease of predicted toxin-antitoxin system